MTKPNLHPWLSTPEAVKAARAAVGIATNKMTGAAISVGADELLSEAFEILTQCALPPRERGHVKCVQCGGSLAEVRAGAKFCSPKCRFDHANSRRGTGNPAGKRDPATRLPAVPKGHIGSMWSWPEDERASYAAKEVAFRLMHFMSNRTARVEVAASDAIESGSISSWHEERPRLQNDKLVGKYALRLEDFRASAA